MEDEVIVEEVMEKKDKVVEMNKENRNSGDGGRSGKCECRRNGEGEGGGDEGRG